MKTSFFNKSVMGMLVVAALALSACGKKDSSSSVRVAGRDANGVQQNIPNTCTSGQSTVGKIFDPYASSQFETQVKNFVSATLDPQLLGSISGNINDKTGVDFIGSFQFDSAGQLVASNSTVVIKVFDSYANQTYGGQVIQPYIVQFNAAYSGSIDRNTRQFTVVFKDDYGAIEFRGSYANGQTAEGTVRFENYKSVSGSPMSGTLGNFRVYSCALIK